MKKHDAMMTLLLSVCIFTTTTTLAADQITYQYDAMGNRIGQFTPDVLQLVDFESGTLAPFYWQHSGTASWQIDGENPIDGDYSLQTGALNENQNSTIATTIYASGLPLSFDLKVDFADSESNPESTLRFYIDEVLQSEFSGEAALTRVLYPLSAGKHQLRWVYDVPEEGPVGIISRKATIIPAHLANIANITASSDSVSIDNLYLPAVPDSDNDGVNDSWEYLHFDLLTTDLSADSDNDGLSTLQEYQIGTEPMATDSDNDGLPDGWEHNYGLNPMNAADALLDNDNDGFSAWQEYRAGSFDNDASSYPQVAYVDFEAAVLSPLYWRHDGNTSWQIDASAIIDGDYALRSGVIGDEQTSVFETSVSASGLPLSFMLSVSSEEGYDELVFYIDDVEQGLWSGEIENLSVSFPLSAGQHRLSWIYQKDSSSSEGTDSAWIDNLSIPVNFDADNDGIDDSWELLYFNDLNADLALDDDNDGLTASQEYQTKTNPAVADSDDDGMNDGWEVSKGLNPLVNDHSGDIDQDGLSNLLEYILAHADYPADRDADNDGIADIFEVNNSMDPLNSLDALIDNDGDGFTVWQEYHGQSSDADPTDTPTGILLGFETDANFGQSVNEWLLDESQSYQGRFSLRAGTIGDDQTSTIAITIDANGETVSFQLMVSSEADYDWLSFYIDDVMQQQWSGQRGFEWVEYPLSSGQHQLKWVYEKDSSVSEGSDSAWIDNLYLPTAIEAK